MGVLYEHWRSDLNECFYVGISWSAEDVRPYVMDNRNYRHLNVQQELTEKGIAPEVRLIVCDHLNKDELSEFETLQIKYWKDKIGSRLTNIHPGGGGLLQYWDEELCERHAQHMTEFYATDKGKVVRAKIDTGIQAWRDRQTEKEKSDQALKIWEKRRDNGTDFPERDEDGKSIKELKGLETKRKNGTDHKNWWNNMSIDERKEMGRLMSEGKKKAREARGETEKGYGRKLSVTEIKNLHQSKKSYWANLSEDEYKRHCENISKGRKAASQRRLNEIKDK